MPLLRNAPLQSIERCILNFFSVSSSLRQPAQVHRGEGSRAKSHGGKCLGDEQCAHRLLQSVRLLDIISSLFVAPRRPRGTTSPALCARTVRRGRGVKRVVVGDGGRAERRGTAPAPTRLWSRVFIQQHQHLARQPAAPGLDRTMPQ